MKRSVLSFIYLLSILSCNLMARVQTDGCQMSCCDISAAQKQVSEWAELRTSTGCANPAAVISRFQTERLETHHDSVSVQTRRDHSRINHSLLCSVTFSYQTVNVSPPSYTIPLLI